MMIYLAVLEHEHGTDVFAHQSKENAGKSLIELMRSIINDEELEDEKGFDQACDKGDWETAMTIYNNIYGLYHDGRMASLKTCKLNP